MAIMSIERVNALPDPLKVSTIYITKNALNAALVDLTFVGNSLLDVRKTLGQADVQEAVDTAIANLTASQIPDLPGTKIVSDLTVNTSGKAATAGVADFAVALAPGANINGVLFNGAGAVTVPAVDTATPRVAVSDIGTTVPPLVGGLIPKQYVPASFDNMEEYPIRDDFPAEGRASVIYIAEDTNLMYRWTGTTYIAVSSGGGIVDEANKLAVARQIALTGDATGQTTFDGSKNESIVVALASVGAAGVQGPVVTTDAKGRVISSAALVAADIPGLPGEKITSTISVDTTGNAATATQFETPVTVTLTGDVTGTGQLSGGGAFSMVTTLVSGGAGGATGSFAKVEVANGLVSSGGPLVAADVPSLPGSKITSALTVDTSGNAATATKLAAPFALNLTGDATGTVQIDGSGAASLAVTVVNAPSTTGASGTYPKVTVVDGLVTGGGPLVEADVPSLSGTKIISDITVNTSGNAATATLATSATTANSATVADGLNIVAEW